MEHTLPMKLKRSRQLLPLKTDSECWILDRAFSSCFCCSLIPQFVCLYFISIYITWFIIYGNLGHRSPEEHCKEEIP